MTDTERLEWIAQHLKTINIAAAHEPAIVHWFDSSGNQHTTIGPRTASWANSLRYAVDEAAGPMPNANDEEHNTAMQTGSIRPLMGPCKRCGAPLDQALINQI